MNAHTSRALDGIGCPLKGNPFVPVKKKKGACQKGRQTRARLRAAGAGQFACSVPLE